MRSWYWFWGPGSDYDQQAHAIPRTRQRGFLIGYVHLLHVIIIGLLVASIWGGWGTPYVRVGPSPTLSVIGIPLHTPAAYALMATAIFVFAVLEGGFRDTGGGWFAGTFNITSNIDMPELTRAQVQYIVFSIVLINLALFVFMVNVVTAQLDLSLIYIAGASLGSAYINSFLIASKRFYGETPAVAPRNTLRRVL